MNYYMLRKCRILSSRSALELFFLCFRQIVTSQTRTQGCFGLNRLFIELWVFIIVRLSEPYVSRMLLFSAALSLEYPLWNDWSIHLLDFGEMYHKSKVRKDSASATFKLPRSLRMKRPRISRILIFQAIYIYLEWNWFVPSVSEVTLKPYWNPISNQRRQKTQL